MAESIYAYLKQFGTDESGQDLIEYSLLLAFVCLAGAAMYIGMGQNTAAIWTIINGRLAAAGTPTP